jgi:hypothetical protein
MHPHLADDLGAVERQADLPNQGLAPGEKSYFGN